MRYSSSYVMTADPKCASSMLELQNLRDLVKKQNAILRRRASQASMNYGPQKLVQFYVKCQGRGPRVKHAVAQGSYRRRYDQSLPLKFAERMDVYVYER
jgi:hypothetical protein